MSGQRILVVDDDEAIRHSLSFMLRHAGFDVKTFPGGEPFLEAVDDEHVSCILLDVRMPDIDGLTVLEELRGRGNFWPVIVLTGHGDVSTAVTAMKSGATDFLEKPYEKQAILDSIAKGFDKLNENASDEQRKIEANARLKHLTQRETEVLELLSDGLTNKAIAERLSISARTVEIHRANLMVKLETESLSGALKVAFAAGIGLAC
ncbi:MAG: DNA-binding response regulator [Ponticaulis sp.]|nr:DNA-binding response regulator [Ponticaulis sp.]